MRREGYEITLDNMKKFVVPYINSFKRDNEIFFNLPPTDYTRATDYVTEQIKLIETLSEKGYTYETSDGIYFEVSKFPNYGEIGNIDLEKLRSSGRTDVNNEKHHPADFALWKKAKMGFTSKWGKGFPGWHIECTAMAFATLGKQIDIHTGGEDLQYTHHNGEIAQAECITGRKFSQFWLHNAHVTMGNEKLAKSAGNGFSLNDLSLKGFKPEDYRYWLLQGHYRTKLDFSFEALDASKHALTRLKRLVYEEIGDQPIGEPEKKYVEAFNQAILDDLDTPQAIAVLWDVAKDEEISLSAKLATIQLIDSVLAIGLSYTAKDGLRNLGVVDESSLPIEVKKLIKERKAARQNKDWETSDSLREQIEELGFIVSDTAEGSRITRS